MGEGSLVAVAMKKLLITDKGKGWAGVTIRDEGAAGLSQSVYGRDRLARWLRTGADPRSGGGYHLIEISPRFPAWVYLSAAAGSTCRPAGRARRANHVRVPQLHRLRIGKLFVPHLV